MQWMIILIALAVIAADLVFYRLRISRLGSKPLKRLIAAFIILSDLMPLPLIALFFLVPDNTTSIMMACMWIAWAFTITVFPRVAYYLFSLFGRKGIARYTGLAAATFVLCLILVGTLHDRTAILVNRIQISSNKLPMEFEGFRIVQFSDLHIGTLLNPDKELARLVDTINSLSPDLVIFSGDLVNVRYSELKPENMKILRRLKATYGVVSVTGNHDVGIYIKDTVSLPRQLNTDRLIDRQCEMGWRHLSDSTIYIVRGKDSISLSGLSFSPALNKFRHAFHIPGIELSKAYEGVPDDIYNITVSHLPQLWQNITDTGHGDLTLAGHVHSMQLKLSIGGFRFSPAQIMYDEWSGRYDKDGNTLYINDGIGYVGFPIRLGARPEVTIFLLKK